MRKPLILLLSLATIVALSVALSSCKDDEPTISGISFELEEQEVTESDGTFASFHPDVAEAGEGRVIEIKLTLDHALEGDAVIRFDIDGTARESATSRELNDYTILEEGDMVTVDEDQLTILKGATEAIIKVVVYEDLDFEYDTEVNDEEIPFENLELSLISVVSGPAKLGAQLDHNMRILEDDAVAFLQWESQDVAPETAAVDMDLLFWLNDELLPYDIIGGAREATSPPQEAVVLVAGFGEGNMGASAVYYSGESDDLDFVIALFTTAGTLNGQPYLFLAGEGTPLLFSGNYKKINRNAWTAEGAPAPKIAQTMVKTGVNYSDISNITPFPDGGSRIGNRVPLKLDPSVLQQLALERRQSLISAKKNGTFKTLKLKQ